MNPQTGRDSLVREVLMLKESRAAACEQEQISRNEANRLRQQLAGAQAEIEKYRLREWACYKALGYDQPINDALPHLIECELAKLKEQVKPLVEALNSCFELIAHAGPKAFENGNKDSTGTIDEGEVIAGRIYEQAKQALDHAKELGV